MNRRGRTICFEYREENDNEAVLLAPCGHIVCAKCIVGKMSAMDKCLRCQRKFHIDPRNNPNFIDPVLFYGKLVGNAKNGAQFRSITVPVPGGRKPYLDDGNVELSLGPSLVNNANGGGLRRRPKATAKPKSRATAPAPKPKAKPAAAPKPKGKAAPKPKSA